MLPRRRGSFHPLGHEPDLAYPRIPDDQHQPGVAAQRSQQGGQLMLTANKARRARHAPSPISPGLPRQSPHPSAWMRYRMGELDY